MNETKHTPTPGPWKINSTGYIGHGNDHGWTLVAAPIRDTDADGHYVKLPTQEEDYANARLIAAAPELLEALQEIAKHTDPADEKSYRTDDQEGCLDTVHAMSKAAIAKATGGAA